jgi:hypothetical protein
MCRPQQPKNNGIIQPNEHGLPPGAVAFTFHNGQNHAPKWHNHSPKKHRVDLEDTKALSLFQIIRQSHPFGNHCADSKSRADSNRRTVSKANTHGRRNLTNIPSVIRAVKHCAKMPKNEASDFKSRCLQSNNGDTAVKLITSNAHR